MKTLFLNIMVISLMMGAVFLAKSAEDSSLALYLPFDEGEGDKLEDISQNALQGSIAEGDPEWVDGKSGSALLFDGQSVIEVPHDASLDMKGELTIAYWLKWDGTVASWSPFVCKRAGTDSNYCTWVGNDNVFDYYTGTAVVSAGLPVELSGEWVFLTVTHDGEGAATFYIDGVLESTKDVPPGVPNKEPFRVGFDGGNARGAGVVDEVALFSRELSEKEIVTLMEEGSEAVIAVKPAGKLTTAWGRIKN